MSKNIVEQLPPILRRRRRNDQNLLEGGVRILELAAYCEANGPLDAWASEPEGTDRKAFLWLLLMAAIGHGLVSKVVPAYRPRVARNSVTVEDWVAAGGAEDNIQFASPDFYAAQFVRLVSRIAKERGRNREWVLRWFLNKEAIGTTAERKRRIEMLPKPYRSRRTFGSLREAFMTIPSRVKKNPDDHLPDRPGFRLAVAMVRASEREPSKLVGAKG